MAEKGVLQYEQEAESCEERQETGVINIQAIGENSRSNMMMHALRTKSQESCSGQNVQESREPIGLMPVNEDEIVDHDDINFDIKINNGDDNVK